MRVYLVFDSDAEPGVPYSAHTSRAGAISVAKECASAWRNKRYPPDEEDTESQFYYSSEDHSVFVQGVVLIDDACDSGHCSECKRDGVTILHICEDCASEYH